MTATRFYHDTQAARRRRVETQFSQLDGEGLSDENRAAAAAAGVLWRGVASGLVWYDLVWSGMVWPGLVWYQDNVDTITYITTRVIYYKLLPLDS